MKTRPLFCVIIFFLFFTLADAADYSGTFISQNKDIRLSVTLQNDGKGGYRGNLTVAGNTYRLQVRVRNGLLAGRIGEKADNAAFQANLNGTSLVFTIVDTDIHGNPLYQTAQTLVLKRQSHVGKKKVTRKAKKNQKDVIINNTVLSKQQINEIKRMYGIQPLPGNYWYDSISGLYGVVGYPAYGYMFSGRRYGRMDRKASNGHTGVILNGRELPRSELTVWSYMLNYWIQPGSYWLDHNGNAGYQGNPIPMVNLFVASRQNAYNGRGGSGDNFWSSRFSAGNYDSGNQRGYVSVPGHGPVGYGF